MAVPKQEIKTEEETGEFPCAVTSTGSSPRSSENTVTTVPVPSCSRLAVAPPPRSPVCSGEGGVTEEKKPYPTAAYFKRTRQEALNCVRSIPNYEIFDMTTGFMKESYRARLSPSPPPCTTVYEVGTGKPCEYVSGNRLMRLNPGSVAFEEAKAEMRAAEQEKSKRPASESLLPGEASPKQCKLETPCPETENTNTAQRGEAEDTGRGEKRKPAGGLRRVVPVPVRKPTGSPTATATRTQGIADACDCISLVTTDSFHIRVCRPAPMTDAMSSEELYTLLAESPTLRHLYRGYCNYVENDLAEDVHTMTAYVCRSTHSKLFSAYKTISSHRVLQGRAPASITSNSDESPSPTLGAINEYLRVFAVLMNFNYTWLLPTIKSRFCNVMVVDKRWTYSPVRQLYLPYYRLLTEDSYTNQAVEELCTISTRGTRVRRVRFLSTTDTVLYTNRRALLSPTNAGDDGGRKSGTAKDHTVPLPPKKRHVGGFGQGSGRESTSTESDDKACAAVDVRLDGSRTTTGLVHEPTPSTSAGSVAVAYRQNMVPSETTRENDGGDKDTRGNGNGKKEKGGDVSNPTLVVFSHIVNAKESDVLVCNILLEINLADRVRY